MLVAIEPSLLWIRVMYLADGEGIGCAMDLGLMLLLRPHNTLGGCHGLMK